MISTLPIASRNVLCSQAFRTFRKTNLNHSKRLMSEMVNGCDNNNKNSAVDLSNLIDPSALKKNRVQQTTTSSAWEKPKERSIEVREKRFDEIYCIPSDKARVYQQTWIDCTSPLIRKKKICNVCLEPQPLMYTKRKPAQRPPTATPPPCKAEQNLKCIKMKYPNCRPCAKVTDCRMNRKPQDCVKIESPYPSFSECIRVKPEIMQSECNCLRQVMKCEAFKFLRKPRLKNLH